MAKILIGSKIVPKNPVERLIRCCSCHKYYDFKGNIFSSIKGNILICPHCGLKHKIDFKLFKDKIGNLIKINGFNLGAIDIGSAAIDRADGWNITYTTIASYNPANASGTITSVEIWSQNTISNCEVATFYNVSGNNFSTRDTEVIGTVLSGAKRTFNVNLIVEAGDYIGMYGTEGMMEISSGGDFNVWYLSGDHIPCTNVTFTFYNYRQISLYGTGTTLPENATGKSNISTSLISVLSRGKIESISAKASLISNIIGILSKGKIEDASAKVSLISLLTGILSRGIIENVTGKASISSDITIFLSRGKIESISGKADITSNIASILCRIKKANAKASINISIDSILSRGKIESVIGKANISSSINIALSKGKIEDTNGKVDITSDIIITLNRGMIEDVSGITSITTLIDILLSRIRNTSGDSQFDTNIDAILSRIISVNGKAILDTLFDAILDRTEIFHVNGKSYIYTSFNVNLVGGKRAFGKADINSLINIPLKRISKGSGRSIFDTLIEVEMSRQLIFTQATLGIESTQATLGIESTQATLGIER